MPNTPFAIELTVSTTYIFTDEKTETLSDES